MATVLLTNYYTRKPLDVIRQELPSGFDLIALDRAGKEEVIRHADRADYILVGGRIPIDREVIQAATRLKMIQRSGVGLDNFDLRLLQERGIPVYVNPGVNARSVAEHTLMLMLAVLRRLPEADSGIRAGQWQKHELGIECRTLRDKTVGLVGMGHIGREVARLLDPFGVTILYHDSRRLTEAEETSLKLRHCALPELMQQADILSLHCPLTAQTEGMIGREQISTMKPGSVIINTSRGRLIDEPALVEGLRSGHLRGAGLDVFAREPLSPENPLRALPQVVLTPHVAGLTIETFRSLMRAAFHNIEAYENGNAATIEDRRWRG